MKVLNTLLLSVALLAAGTTQAQTDKDELEHAWNAIHVVKSCDDALHFLSNVSADGKTTAPYFMNMANAHDCKSNYEQALYYYNKYLELQPKNDSVRKRVAELSDGKLQAQKAANEERVAREVYGNAAQTKKVRKKHDLLTHYFCIGGTYSLPAGGNDRPYNTGAGINFGLGYPIADKRLVLDFASNTDFVFGQNMSWWMRAYNRGASLVSAAGFGVTQDIEACVMATILNHKKVAWIAGPMVGTKYVYTPDPIYNSSDDNISLKGGSVFGLCYGAKTSVLLKDHGLFFVEYSGMPVNKFTTSNNRTGVNANHSMLRIGVTLRADIY